MPAPAVGDSPPRKEDLRFLTGRGRYVADLPAPDALYAAFVRCDHAHAVLTGVDTQPAMARPGVVAAFCGEQLRALGMRTLPNSRPLLDVHGARVFEPPRPALAIGRVRYVGEAVAVVLAPTAAGARDGADAVVADVEPLPAVGDVDSASAEGAPRVWDEVPGNRLFEWHWGDAAATTAAFARAAHVVGLRLVNNRLVPNAMEPRALLARPEPDGRLTVWVSHQAPHTLRDVLALVLDVQAERLRVVAPDVGGGFGAKLFTYPEEATVAFLARHLGRAVRWTASRSEAFLGDAHGRDHVEEAQLALDARARFLGLRLRSRVNLGAYLSNHATAIPTRLFAPMLPGVYRVGAVHAVVHGMVSNTAPVDAYRGAGRPEASYIIERLVDEAAFRLRIDAAELRSRNMVRPADMPFVTATGLRYDVGDFPRALEMALVAVDRAGFAARRECSRAAGRLRGLGLASWVEATVGGGPVGPDGRPQTGVSREYARLRVDADGKVVLAVGSHSHGQGHETVFAQLVAGRLGIAIERVAVEFGDTDRVPYGEGAYGSRSLSLAGSAAYQAAERLIAKGRRIAAHALEVSADDLDYADGAYRVAGTDLSLSFAAMAAAAHDAERLPDDIDPGLDEHAMWRSRGATFPAGCHVAEVEVDPETGLVRVLRYVGVDDFGVALHPVIVEGQMHGGLAQGIGQALLEHCVYEAGSGQLLSGSFMDYAMPRADDLPRFELERFETPATSNPMGIKGCGEGGCIAAPTAVVHAVLDALRPAGVRHLDMPLTPLRVWQALQQAGSSASSGAAPGAAGASATAQPTP